MSFGASPYVPARVLSVIGRALGSDLPSRECSPSLAALAESLALAAGLLKRAATAAWKTTPPPELSKISNCLDFARSLLQDLPQPSAEASEAETRDDFFQCLETLLAELRSAAARPGSVVIIPGGWLRRRATAGCSDLGHAVLLVLFRSVEAEEFILGVVNTGEGLQYHPASLSRAQPNPEMPLRQSPLVLTSIPIDRVCSSALWYLLYRQILHPDPENGPEAMYGHLLPFLNQRPLSASTGPQSWTEQLPVPVAGDRSFALCVERSVRFALVLSGLEPSDADWWSSVGLRRALVECMQEALAVQGLRAPAPAEFALLRVGVSSLARAAAQSAKVQEKGLGRLKLSEEVQAVIEAADRKAVAMEHSQRNARSVQPPQLWEDLWSAASRQDCHFGGFSRTLSQDVEALKGEARHGTLILPSLPAALRTQINNCTEAAECCRLVSSMVALMSNQRDRLPQASASCFTLVVHLVCRLLPMPLPLDDDYWPDKCFWAGQPLTLETKRDLLRSLHLISRYFSASAENLRATRETDGARTCVAAALVVMMDALLRRPIDLLDKQVAVQERHGDLISLHYSGAAGGHQSPCKPFLLDSSTFRETSEALLLPQPELALLRAQVLDYFQSLTTLATSSSRGSMNAKRLFRQLTRVKETQEHETQYLFTFEKGMALGPADRLFVEQLGLSIGLESAGPSAHLLLSGEQPQLLDFYPELAWFRDAVFLWKVLLLPPADDESDKASPRGDISAALGAPLVWRWQKGKKSEGTEELGAFVVHGFEAVLPNTQSFSFKAWWKSRRWQGLRGLKRWLGGQAENYSSNFRALSRANPSLLAGSAVETEEDILALQSVPCFGGSLKASESELLLTYLVAPYVRIPLVLNFFSDKQRMTLLQAPQLQAVLDAVLFEPGPWLTYQEALAGPPGTVPSKSLSAPATRAGLLLNELQYSPEVLDSVLQLLQFAYEQDPGRPGTGREGLILFLVRLAVRVESHAMLVLQRARGASTGAGARQVAPRKDKLQSLEDRTKRLSGVLRNAVLEMMLQWASQAIKRKPRKLDIAARVHAHIAFLFKNHRPDTVREVSVFLASQVFVIMNSFKPATKRSPSSHLLGVGEFELFDVFERWRTPLASWLRAHPTEAAVAMENIERVVTCKGTADITAPDANRSWREMPNEPGNWASRPSTEGQEAVPGESYREWLLRTYHQASAGGADIVVSVNQGRYHCRDAGLQLLPEHALRSPHLLEACGNLEHMQVVLREETLHRTCYELVGQNLEVHCWDAERLDENGLPEWLNTRNLQKVGDKPAWLAEVLEPVLAKLELGDMVLYYQASKQDKPAFPDAWLLGVPKESQSLIKEIAVWRSPAYMEIYDLVSRGRHVHRKLVFTSDMVWSFHSPSGKELPMYSSPNAGWSLGKGSVLAPSGRGSGSLRIFRTSGSQGQEEYIPQEILQGLLPDALLHRYKFWRSQEANGELLVGEERDVADQPTELRVKIQPVKTLKREPGSPSQGAFEAALATVERRRLLGQEPEFLVNAKSGMCGLTNLLTRLENLSHILVWSRSADGAGGVHRIEMPRLMLSFTMQDGRLHCDQLAGYWILERPQLTSNLVHQLVAQWGGGTVLLETAAGDLSVLVSALSEPVRPWAERADSLSPAERFLPGQLVLRRGKPSWMANLAEGSRYYFYPLHRCGMMVFTPTPAASLYLLLCRYLTWHFQEVAAMASAISEVSGPEERQLWECLSVLQGECHADAVACRLHLTLASLPFGKDARPPWDVVKQLLEYSSKRHLVSATCALPAHGELVLQNLPEVMSQASALPLLATRREMLEHLLAAKASGSQKSMTAPLGPQREDAGFDRVAYRHVLGEVGLFQRMACSMQGLTYSRPEGERPVVEGFAALRFLDALFGRAGASTGGLLAFRGSFFLIYELFTGTLEVKLLPEDKPSILASALLRLIESGNSGNSTTQMEMAVLRSLDSTPEVRAEMPLWGSAAAKRVWQVGALIKVDHDSSSRLLKNAVKHLRQCHQYLQPVRKFPEFQRVDGKLVIDPEDLNHRRQWAPPLTEDVNCTSRAFETKAAAMLCLGACPLAKLVSDCFGRDPLQSPTSNVGGSNDVLEKRDANGQLLKLWLQKLCGPHADPNFRFASLPPSQRTLSRLLDELSLFLSSPVAGETLQEVVQPTRLAKLVDALRVQGQEDMREATALVTGVVEGANCGNAKDWLLRRCGTAVHVSFSSLVAALMASEPGCSDALYRANQELREDKLSSLFEKVAQALALIVRVGQVTRAMEKALDLQSAISRRSEALIVSLKARTLSEELLAKRHHSRAKRASVLFDPRLLVFEFLFDIMLRETQVRILGAFLYSAKVGRSMTHQMIMGDGKTTVIAPLLALILADGKSLVCSCMPAALAEMTRSVLTRCTIGGPASMEEELCRAGCPDASRGDQRHILTTQNVEDHVTSEDVDGQVEAVAPELAQPAPRPMEELLKQVAVQNKAQAAANKEQATQNKKMFELMQSLLEGNRQQRSVASTPEQEAANKEQAAQNKKMLELCSFQPLQSDLRPDHEQIAVRAEDLDLPLESARSAANVAFTGSVAAHAKIGSSEPNAKTSPKAAIAAPAAGTASPHGAAHDKGPSQETKLSTSDIKRIHCEVDGSVSSRARTERLVHVGRTQETRHASVVGRRSKGDWTEDLSRIVADRKHAFLNALTKGFSSTAVTIANLEWQDRWVDVCDRNTKEVYPNEQRSEEFYPTQLRDRRFSSPVAPRAVISFKFGRASHADRALFDKLEAARHGKAVVVAEPTSLKSLVLGLLQSLSQLEELTSGSSKRWWKTDAHNQRTHVLEAEAHACSQVLRMFHRSVLLLDEVDLLLDPLKSELNWPMGTKRAIDLVDSVKNPNSASGRFDHDNCLRGKLPFHVLDALFVASALAEVPDSEPTAEQVGKHMAVPFADRQEAATSLLELAAELKVGCEARHVRLCPHLVLHSQSFCESHLLPRLSNWTALFLESHNGALGLTPQELRRVLRQPRDMDAIVAQQLRRPGSCRNVLFETVLASALRLRENGPAVQLFNLAVRWLHSFLPFLLKKVHRVSYGLLSTEQLASESGPRSRQLLSVPFVGKDQPSEQAEFSHPDVAIGFSILAYRLQGLRSGDLLALMQALQADMKLQSGIVYHKRLANRTFVKLVVKAGGRVRGFSAEGKWLGDKKGSLEVAEVLEMETILPLEAVDLNDTEQLAQLWSLLRAEPCAVEQFLLSVLQPGVGTVDVSDHQLTAAGQDLAGEQLFGLCLGFSGTPNDLLPSRLGRCCYAQGVDGRILGTLVNTDVVNVVEIDADWTPRMLLELAAGVNGPCFNAFIDVGALVTGLSNRETADYLLRVGLKVVELAQCGLAPSQRFTFYDHVHTTGMDIKQPPAGRAVLTMGKDTTLRDFAQGAYRMRGLGAGQQISVLMTPEVSTLVHQCRKACTAARLAGSGRISVTLENFLTPSSPTSPTRQKEADPVVHVLVWATANGIRQECRKQRLLCQQNFRDVWKRKARLKLENVAAAVFDPKDKSAVDSLRAVSTQAALEDLRSRPEFFGLPPRVEIQVQGKEPSLQEKLQMEISKRKLSPAERAEADAVLAECWPPECEIDFLEEPKNDAMEGEQVQEEEQEEEQEQEQEQEQEKEQEQEGLPEEPANEKFSRADERQQPWNLSSLACQPSNRTKPGSSPPFYPISDFAVHRGMLGGDCNFLDELPPFLMISDNYYRKAWRMQSTRRLRNIICVLEWVPDRQQLQPLEIPGQLSAQQIEWLRLLFELHRWDGGETAGDKVTGENLTALYKSLGLWGTASQESCSFDALQRGVATQSLYGYQQGRFFVALSLEEAQHLRAALHRGEEVLNKEVFKLSSPLLTLRCLCPGGPKEPVTVNGQRGLERHFVLADFGNERATVPRFDLEVAEHCFHFANCDLLPRSQLPVLLRALRGAEPEKRLRWWQDLRRCRRRTRESWQRLPIGPVFLEKDEFKALASEALLQRLRRSLAERQLWPADVFHLLDTHSCGSLAPADVERGLEWMLGFQGSQVSSLQIATRFPALLTALFRALDEDGDGRITVEEFKAALEPDEPAG
ncbi:unnamed protein product [Symbiodinium microadriaticum]|nr:unnamed protein product [Symbiodinium microadriaticum]